MIAARFPQSVDCFLCSLEAIKSSDPTFSQESNQDRGIRGFDLGRNYRSKLRNYELNAREKVIAVKTEKLDEVS